MAELFRGVVTFLFTDVEGSTALWEEAPDSMMDALRVHDGIIEAAAADHHGIPVKPRGEGDSRFVVFDSATNAVAAAARIQAALAATRWPTPRPLRIRISLHTGTAELQLGDYYGSAVNRAARLRAIAHGGQTVMSRSTWELVRDTLPTDVTVVDMGDHRLKDLTRPEHVYQINVAGLEDAFPPLASLDAVPTNLPVQVTEFIGRDRELGEVVDLLSHSRLVTILAPGGAGKTRLAVQAAADASGLHPDGVFFVDLSPLTSPAEVPQAVAEAMGITLSGEGDPGGQLLTHLAQDTLLLVLDNFEHVSDAADLVATMMRAAPGVRVVVTSRTKLGVEGETVYPLRGLEITWDTPENAHRVGGVQLFIDAAKRADASFSLGLSDLDALAEILAIVGGLPLGILLAAAWVETLPVSDIATELAASMDFLASDVRNIPERQRSMRAVFDYSWRLLGDADRSLFGALSLFRGGFDRQAALAVAGATPRNLATLVGKSLLVTDRDSGRYVVQETLRLYAEESLRSDTGRWESVMAAHVGYYADLAHAAEMALVTSHDQRGAILSVEGDLENIRAALKETLRTRDAVQARRLLMGLAWFYEGRGWVRAELDLVTEVKAAFATVEGDAAAIVRAVSMAFEAKLLENLGHPDDAGRLAPEALQALERCDDAVAYVAALEVLCENRLYTGDLEGVMELSTETIRAAREAGLEIWAAGMRNYQAVAHVLSGDFERAGRLLGETDAVLGGADEHIFRTWTLEGQAALAMMQGRVDDAIHIRTKQLQLAREIGYLRTIGSALHGLAIAHLQSGDPDTARGALFESLSIFERMGLATDMAAVLVALARVIAAEGSPQMAVGLLACVLGDPVSGHYLPTEQTTIGALAEQALGTIEPELAAAEFAEARRSGGATPLAVAVKDQLERQRRIA